MVQGKLFIPTFCRFCQALPMRFKSSCGWVVHCHRVMNCLETKVSENNHDNETQTTSLYEMVSEKIRHAYKF